MLRTIKNVQGKVTGLQINGKNFFLAKDVCHALMLEEKLAEQKTQQTIEKLKSLQHDNHDVHFITEGSLLKTKLFFDELGRINNQQSVIEFKQLPASCSKDDALKLLNDFVLVFNRAQYQRHNYLNEKLTTMTKAATGNEVA